MLYVDFAELRLGALSACTWLASGGVGASFSSLGRDGA
jgi:hypothetical protein